MNPKYIPSSMLESTEPFLLIVEKRSRLDIVIGAPHHALAGKPHLPCPEHSESDENTGYKGVPTEFADNFCDSMAETMEVTIKPPKFNG